MRIEVITYKHTDNGLSLQAFPETDAEEALLWAMWQHGRMVIGHPCGARGSWGFYVSAFNRVGDAAKENE